MEFEALTRPGEWILAAAVKQQVSVEPNPNALPGMPTAEKLARPSGCCRGRTRCI